MAVKENVQSTVAYIKINRGKDEKNKDIILKAFKLPVSPTVTDEKISGMLLQVQELTNYPVSHSNLDVLIELVDEATV